MVLAASDYPQLDLFWTTFFIFGWILWFWLFIRVYSDVFRRRDVAAGRRPVGGLHPRAAVHRRARLPGQPGPRDAGQRALADMQYQRSATDAYIRSVATDARLHAAGQGRGPAGPRGDHPRRVRPHGRQLGRTAGGRTVRSCPGRRTGGRVRVADERDGEHAALTASADGPRPGIPGRGPSGVSSRVRACGGGAVRPPSRPRRRRPRPRSLSANGRPLPARADDHRAGDRHTRGTSRGWTRCARRPEMSPWTCSGHADCTTLTEAVSMAPTPKPMRNRPGQNVQTAESARASASSRRGRRRSR